MAQRETELVFSPDARRQLLRLKSFDQRRLVDAIGKQLIEANPRSETRNKFAVDPPPDCADFELRVGDLPVLYRVEQDEDTMNVIVAIIGRKVRARLIMEGEVFEL